MCHPALLNWLKNKPWVGPMLDLRLPKQVANVIRFLGLCSLLMFTPVSVAVEQHLTLIHMGDIHGHLVPRHQVAGVLPDKGVKVGGLAYMYSQVQRIRNREPNTLLINTGDTIQGSAEALFSQGQAMVDVLNLFDIDAYAPGNWDFLYGTERFRALFAGNQPIANWKAIAANLYYSTLYEFPATQYADRAGQRVLPPYLIYKVGSIKVGIVGLTAERGPKALSPRVMDGFYLTTGQDELEVVVPLLRDKENVDIVILISERGLANNIALARRFPGIDIVLSSDMHEETHRPVALENGTLIVEVGQDGSLLGELNLTVSNRDIVDWTWKAHRISTQNNKPDPIIAERIKQIRSKYVGGVGFSPHVNPINGALLRTPIDTVIGHTRVPLHRAGVTSTSGLNRTSAVIEGTSHNFLADAFRVSCNADVGVMRGFRYGTHIPSGPIALEDIYHYIPIGPQIACGLVSGDDLRLQIERSAQSTLTQWVGAWGGGWMLAYSGVTYDLDPLNEFGFRASNIRVNVHGCRVLVCG